MLVNFPINVPNINNSSVSKGKKPATSGYTSDCFVKSETKKEIKSFDDINSIKVTVPSQIECSDVSAIPKEKKQDFAKRLFDALAEGSTVKMSADMSMYKCMEKAGFYPNGSIVNKLLANSVVFEKRKDWGTLETLVKDKEGNWVEATIGRFPQEDLPAFCNGIGKIDYIMQINGKIAAEALVMDAQNDDSLYLSALFLKNKASDKYRGIGSELLKCAVQESINRGYKGKISLLASYQPAPFVFYYKNNCKICNELELLNPALDYAAKNDLDIEALIPPIINICEMELDEKGAEAFLKGQRLYERRPSCNISKKNINGTNYLANLVQFNDNKFYIQVLDNDSKYNKLKTAASVEVKEDDKGKYLEVYYLQNAFVESNKDSIKYLNESIRLFAKTLEIARIMAKA